MSRSTNKRSLGTFVALLLVPAAAVAVLSVGLGTASGDTAPSGVLVSESRAVAFTGDNLASAPAVSPGPPPAVLVARVALVGRRAGQRPTAPGAGAGPTGIPRPAPCHVPPAQPVPYGNAE